MERVQLIEDLSFETATTKIKETPDGEFLIASGLALLFPFSADPMYMLSFGQKKKTNVYIIL